MPPKLKVPPNAKFQPQNPKYVGNETGSKDPEDLKSRLFVGCLNLETCQRNDLIELFSMYGPLKGVTHFVKGGYAFIQYEAAEDAEDAVLNLNRYMFQGIRLDVKFVQKDPSAPASKSNRQGPNARRFPNGPPQKRKPNGAGPLELQGRFDEDVEEEAYDEEPTETPAKRFGRSDSKNNGDGENVEEGQENENNDENGDDCEKTELDEKRAEANELARKKRVDKIKAQIYENVEDEEGSVLDQNDIPDILICGGCHLITSSVDFFYAHRLKSCDRKIVNKLEEEPKNFKCFHCDETCKTSWELVMHIGKKHKTMLYKEHEPKTDEYPPLFID